MRAALLTGLALSVACATPPPPLPTARPLRDVESLAWLAGSWAREGDRSRWEEHWTVPAGGTMVGMARMVRDGVTAFTESLLIEEREDGIYYGARPSNQPEAAYKLIINDAGRAVFTNPEHALPHTIGYDLAPDGSLMAWIENERDGETWREHFPVRPSQLVPDY